MRITKERLHKISDILSDIAQVLFATFVLQFFIDRFSLLLLVLGILSSSVTWLLSIYLIKK